MSFDKNKWLALASSENKDDVQLALSQAKDWAELLQMELLYWFGCNTTFEYRFHIYALLQEENQIQALALIADKGDLSAFDRTNTFEEFAKADSTEMQQAIIHLERWFMKPDKAFKNSLYLEYKNRKGCEMEESKLAVNRLFLEEPGQIGDDEGGESRTDE
jgi:hypothetical protein